MGAGPGVGARQPRDTTPQAGERGAKAEDVLGRFEQRMSREELRAVRDGD